MKTTLQASGLARAWSQCLGAAPLPALPLRPSSALRTACERMRSPTGLRVDAAVERIMMNDGKESHASEVEQRVAWQAAQRSPARTEEWRGHRQRR